MRSKIVKRLRWWFESHQVPLTVQLEKSNLSLKALSPIQVTFSEDCVIQKHSDLQWKKFTAVLLEDKFKIDDVSRALQLSDRSARRLLNWAKRSGFVNGGRGTGQKSYHLSNKWKRAA